MGREAEGMLHVEGVQESGFTLSPRHHVDAQPDAVDGGASCCSQYSTSMKDRRPTGIQIAVANASVPALIAIVVEQCCTDRCARLNWCRG
jgi:hypothetical protein